MYCHVAAGSREGQKGQMSPKKKGMGEERRTGKMTEVRPGLKHFGSLDFKGVPFGKQA